MDHLNAVPSDFSDAADWALAVSVADEDEQLHTEHMPFHSILLRSISPVIAGLVGTQSQLHEGRFVIEFPTVGDSHHANFITAKDFLRWLYRQKVEWDLSLAIDLARLSHLWNIPGTAEPYLILCKPC